MGVKIQLHYERKEISVIEYELTPEQYKEFLEHRKNSSTGELGEWVAANGKEGKEVDAYGSSYQEINTIYNPIEHEYIQD